MKPRFDHEKSPEKCVTGVLNARLSPVHTPVCYCYLLRGQHSHSGANLVAGVLREGRRNIEKFHCPPTSVCHCRDCEDAVLFIAGAPHKNMHMNKHTQRQGINSGSGADDFTDGRRVTWISPVDVKHFL